jgi:hypothetical protein
MNEAHWSAAVLSLAALACSSSNSGAAGGGGVGIIPVSDGSTGAGNLTCTNAAALTTVDAGAATGVVAGMVPGPATFVGGCQIFPPPPTTPGTST